MASSLSAAIMSVSNLDDALLFYRDLLGLTPSANFTRRGDAFARHWNVSPNMTAQAVLLSNGDSKIGRMLLMEFEAPNRERIYPPNGRTYRGFWNLNFYVDDLEALVPKLKSRGIKLWRDAIQYNTIGMGGSWLEAVAEGPDGIAVAIFQLLGEKGSTVEMVRSATTGRTATGFSEIGCTSHCVADFEKARTFYEKVLGMRTLVDDLVTSPELNKLNGRLEHGHTRWGFMAGDSMFGKVMVSNPVNYDVPERVHLAAPPNVGYVAQSFEVDDLDAAHQACKAAGAEIFSQPLILNYPGLGPRRTMIARNPGSGALTELVQKVAMPVEVAVAAE
jgi:catechol 2,3-dioxygenase-like lactoylglutathione lyase family enzyme